MRDEARARTSPTSTIASSRARYLQTCSRSPLPALAAITESRISFPTQNAAPG